MSERIVTRTNVRCRDCKMCNKSASFCNRKGKIVDIDVIRNCEAYTK